MPSVTDQLDQQATRDENQGIAIAAHNATWAEQFNSTPPIEKLRANLNLTNLVDTAVRRKQEVLAQTDLKAQELLHRAKKFEQWEQDAPLRTELLTRKVESEGAHERFVQKKDAEAMADVAGFFSTVGKIAAKPGTPEYQSSLNAAIQQHPRIIGTQAGADALKKLQQEHADIAAITPPAGMKVDRIDIGEDGKAKAVFKPITSPAKIPDGMVASGATVNKRGDVSVNYAAPKSTDPLKVASQVRGQIRSLDEQTRLHDKTIKDIEKDAPEWLKTTGIFTDAKGVRRFGFTDKKAEDSPVVTQADEEKMNRYNAALKARADLSEKLPVLNQQLDDILSGKVQAAGAGNVPPTTPPVTAAVAPSGDNPPQDISPEEHAKLKPGDKFFWKGKELTKQ